MKVLLLENIHPIARQMFEQAGHQVEEIGRALLPGELAEMEADVIGIRSQTKITKAIFAKPRLVVAAYCIGINQIDLATCDTNGCITLHDRYNNARSVAELCIVYIGLLLRNLFLRNAETHSGKWNKAANGAKEIRGKTLGVVGWGNIGQQVGRLAEAMGMHVVFYDLEERPAHGNAKKCSSLKELLAKSDVVSLHVDGRGQNRNFFGSREIAAMKPGAYFMNLSRGIVVDEKALATALKNGILAGAAIDVHQREPADDGEFTSPLQGLPNAILTPHIGGSTEEAQEAIGISTTRRILDYLAKGTIQLSPSFPQRSFADPLIPGTKRIVYAHDNVPGQISQASEVLARHGLNIVGQHLMTNERVGYATFDVEQEELISVIEELQNLPGAIRVRILGL